MNTYSQIVYSQAIINQAIINNSVCTAIALSKCNVGSHSTPSRGAMCVCAGMLLLVVIAFIASFIIIRKS